MCLGTLTCSKCGKEIDPNYDHECMSAEMLLHRAYPLLETYGEYIDGYHHPKHVALVHQLVQDIKEHLLRSLNERMYKQYALGEDD